MALIDAEGHVLASANVQDRVALAALDDGKKRLSSLHSAKFDGASRSSAARIGA
ncbi:hypothetical protein [Methylobacterium sp. CM6244]